MCVVRAVSKGPKASRAAIANKAPFTDNIKSCRPMYWMSPSPRLDWLAGARRNPRFSSPYQMMLSGIARAITATT
jgi:hypothetical protein